MKNLWQKLRSAAEGFETVEMARLILQILNATAGSEARFRPFRELVVQHEARLLAAGEGFDTIHISEIAGILCRAMFAVRHEGQPMAECEELILILNRAGNECDTMLIARTFERLCYLCDRESRTAMDSARSENIKMARERVAAAVASAAPDEIAVALADMLWSLAEARPDFEELPIWIREREAATSGVEMSRRASAAVKYGHEILRRVAQRYGNKPDELSLEQAEAKFTASRSQVPVAEYALFLADGLDQASQFHAGVTRLPLTLEGNRIRIGRHTQISFTRTLRVPEDGKEYPLPAGFGTLPILRVEDYAERVPAKWLEEGGFIIPLYQREALFLEFEGVEWRPTIAKVAVGRVNAVSGKTYDLAVRPHRQDYVVIPDQHWLDGINSGDGSVSQFVAMPLGEGYTIEAQVTDEEKHGGFQFAVFDPKPERFPDLDPVLRAQRELLRRLPAEKARVIRALQKHGYYMEVARQLGISLKEVATVVEQVKSQFEKELGPHGFVGVIPDSHSGILFASQALGASQAGGRGDTEDEMGIAAGGRIRQKIIEDTYGVESWNEASFREVGVHIVNSAVFKELTGKSPPPTPITPKQYKRYGMPWYSDYDERITRVAFSRQFRRILSIGQIDRKRGNNLTERSQAIEVTPEQILRIRTPDGRERVSSFVARARASFESGRYRIAAREATLALDIDEDTPAAYLIRAQAHHHLGFHADAEADASSCIDRDPTQLPAVQIRAVSCLALGEIFAAKEDADSLLEANPDDETGLIVRAEVHLRLENYPDAINDANRLLQQNETHPEGIRIRSEACRRSGLLPL